ncbi:MAG: AI-2E family transporter [Acidimicrobiia bacterium]|nr:AI-2E family transporter [Acidimicrobiia bacterium]
MEDQSLPPWISALLWRIVFVVLVTAAGLWAAWQLRSILIALLVSLFVSFAFEPAVASLARRGWQRGRATGVVLLLAMVGLIGVGVVVLPPFVTQVSTLLERSAEYLDSLGGEIELFGTVISLASLTESAGSVSELISRYASTVAEQLAGVVGAVGSLLIQTFTVLLFSYYLLADGPRLRRALFGTFSPDRQREVARMWEISIEKTGGYVVSRVQLAAISAVIHSVAFAVVGLPSPIAYGIWVGVISQFIPAVGAYLAAILPILAGLTVDPTTAIWAAVVLLAYQQVENYWLAPKIAEQRMALHPAVGFAAAIAGILLMGALGAFLALPVAAIGQAFVSTSLSDHPVASTIRGDDDHADGPWIGSDEDE